MKTIKFLEKKNFWFTLSIGFVVMGVILMCFRGFQAKPILNYGIDFSGGSTMMLHLDDLSLRLEKATTKEEKNKLSAQYTQKVRDALVDFKLEGSGIQVTEDGDLLIKTVAMDSKMQDLIRENLQKKVGQFEVLELDFIGPTIGAELRQRAVWIVIAVTLALMGYISFRFQLNFGIATLAATLHDAFVLVAFASIFQMEINIEFIAVLLTVLGYSMNDTVVIFDRIRENLERRKSGESLLTLINVSLTQTLSRTLYTVLTTLFVTVSLLIFGGASLREFSLLLFVGIVVGTYSSLCIAAPTYFVLQRKSIEGDRETN